MAMLENLNAPLHCQTNPYLPRTWPNIYCDSACIQLDALYGHAQMLFMSVRIGAVVSFRWISSSECLSWCFSSASTWSSWYFAEPQNITVAYNARCDVCTCGPTEAHVHVQASKIFSICFSLLSSPDILIYDQFYIHIECTAACYLKQCSTCVSVNL